MNPQPSLKADETQLNSPGASISNLRVAIVHYLLVRRRGGERVIEVLADMFPQADIFTLVLNPDSLGPSLRSRKIATSFLQRIPGATRHYRMLLPLIPLAVEQFRLDDYDLVLSSESLSVKGVLTRAGTCHICYCHTPMRYIWDMYHDYREMIPGGGLGKVAFGLIAHYLRLWDCASSMRVDYFVASSRNGASRIRKHYHREAEVIYPPVDLAQFTVSESHDDFYLVVSPLSCYKRVDLAIAACNALKRRLVVIGEGEESSALRKMAGPTVTFLGNCTDDEVRNNYMRCRAFLFPGEEDIGLTAVEAQACGRPVIAFGRGGALETVAGFCAQGEMDPQASTGVFFFKQSLDSLVEALRVFESVENRFSPRVIRTHAEQFDVSCFRRKMSAFIAGKMAEFRAAQVPYYDRSGA
jgi:glycosyltransferase involved in cell wall biosynthesis